MKLFPAHCRFLGACLLATLLGCSDGADSPAPLAVPASLDGPGPYAVSSRTLSILNSEAGRPLTVELWYPAQSGGPAQSILDFEADVVSREALSALLQENPDNCVRVDTGASRAAPAAKMTQPLPLVLFSHCHNCTRYSSYSIAERLASHGIAVAAPDHMMNTLLNSGALLSGEFLTVRASDIRAVLDELLIPNSAALPEDLQGRFDTDRIGAMGHSFGAVTTGRVLQDDDRFKAGFIMAAPAENPVIPGVLVSEISEPTLYLIAQEDNSISELGNILMRANFGEAASPSWKVEVADAGHWSFSDIAGVIPEFAAGCGAGERQTNPGEDFTYLSPAVAMDITTRYALRFFAAHLQGNTQALAELDTALGFDEVSVESR